MNNLDKCITCSTETQYPINLHIELRKNYVEGIGQLCSDCYGIIYQEEEE